MSKKDLYLLDGSGYIFRAYYALPPLTRSDGLPIGAIYGFCQMLLNVIDKKPANIAVVFDSGRENFRNDIYPQYKSNRGEAPEDLIPQFPFFRAAADALALPLLAAKGYEADDIIATLATRAADEGFNVKIYSSDKDLMQLIGKNISLIDPFKNREVTLDRVFEKFGVPPEKVVDVQALMGDPSDGFPGLPGIGPKTAANLINQFGDLEGLLANVDKIENKRQQEIVGNNIKEARIFYQLATLRLDAPLQLAPNQCAAPLNPSHDQQMAALKFFEELEFNTLAKKWRRKFNLGDEEGGEDDGDSAEGDNPAAKKSNGKPAKSASKNKTTATSGNGKLKTPTGANHPAMEKNATTGKIDNKNMTPSIAIKKPTDIVMKTMDEKNAAATLPAFVEEVKKFGRCGFILTDESLAMSLENGEGFIFPLAAAVEKSSASHGMESGLFEEDSILAESESTASPSSSTDSASSSTASTSSSAASPSSSTASASSSIGKSTCVTPLFNNQSSTQPSATATIPDEIKIILADSTINKFNHEAVSTSLALKKHGITTNYITDVSVLHFCLFAGAGNNDLDDIRQDDLEKFIKEKNKEKEKENTSIDLHQQLCFMAYQFLRLGVFYEQKLAAQKLSRLYQQIEKPLLPLLVAMEERGIAIDTKKFAELGKTTDEKLADLAKKIFAELGQEFNLSSPKQLGDVLFNVKKFGGDKMAKTKTGQFSTSSEVLESLAVDYPIVADILYHRHLEKLNNTYISTLPSMARTDGDGLPRLHTHFSSTSAQTGRLSSLNPNLQNIPIRSEDGIALRECFIAAPDKILLSLDYSQIELRILALLSGTPALQKAFVNGDDIHKSTAAEIFDTPLDKVSPELRRRAKAVNFGIIYGISAFGLSRQLQIPQAEAKDIIVRYFEKMAGIKKFMEQVVADTEKNGFVETLFGRRIYLPAINSKGPAKAYAVRQAMNAPLQGTAADIIKRAMVKINHHLEEQQWQKNCQMILQIHDELLFEVAEGEVDAIAPVLKKIMSEVSLFGFAKNHWPAPSHNMASWPDQDFLFLPVEGGIGKNWRAAH